MPAPLAYIMSRFPHLPETFILREMEAVQHLGWPIELYPLIQQRQAVMHAEAQAWNARAHALPYLSPAVLRANAVVLARRPVTYAHTFGQGLWGNRRDFNLLARTILLWPKAVYAARQMQAQGIRHIHAHYATHPALVAWVIHRLTGIPYSVTVHAHDIFVRKAMLALKLREAAFVVAISDFNREYLATQVDSSLREKTHVIHCGIEPERYPPQAPVAAAGTFEILNIGSLQPYKGQRYLIDACARLRDQGLSLHCRIIGGGELRAALQQQLDELNLHGIVELVGPLPQTEVTRLLPTAHCLAMPSIITSAGKMEGIPVSIMEAFACGVPVVASQLSGIPELVQPGVTGRLVPPADAVALAAGLAQVWANLEEARRLAQAGRTRVLQDFNIQTSARQLAALFEQSVTAGRPV